MIESKKILLIDDDEDDRDMFFEAIKDINALHSCISMENGEKAINYLKSEKQLPDIIFLDINMPGVDGIEILAYLRREPRLIPVPVFVITSDDQPETRRKVMKLGANVMIIKPATIDALEDGLKKVRFLK